MLTRWLMSTLTSKYDSDTIRLTCASFLWMRSGSGTRDSSIGDITESPVLVTTWVAGGELPARPGPCCTRRAATASSPHDFDSET